MTMTFFGKGNEEIKLPYRQGKLFKPNLKRLLSNEVAHGNSPYSIKI